MSTTATPRASRSRKSGDPIADRAKADAKDQAAATKLADQAAADQAAEVQVRDITDETPEQAKARKAAAKIRDTATRATWKQHGNPSRFVYFGQGTASPDLDGIPAVVLQTDKQGISLDDAHGNPLTRFGSATKFWAAVNPADLAVVKAKATRAAKPPTGDRAAKIAELQPKAPAGYAVLWPHASHSLLKATDTAPEDASPWLVLCNEHATTTTATNARDGETKGTKAQRLTWCPKCKAADAKATKDQAKAQAKADQAKDDADSPATKAAADRILAGDSTLADEISNIIG